VIAPNRPFLALGLRLLSGAAFSAMLLLVKLSGKSGVSLPEIMFWRQCLPAVGLIASLGLTGRMHLVRTQRPGLHARRSIIGTSNMFLTLGAVQLMPLAEATVLSFTAPVFAVILAVVMLGERVGRWRLGALVLGLAGVVVIAGPDHGLISPLALIVGLGAAFGVALVSIQVRQMSATEAPITVVFWFSLVGTVLLLPLLLIYGKPHSLAQWATLAGVGICGLAGQLLMTGSLRHGSVSSVIVMDYAQLGWATVWGWLVFDQLPPAMTWVGGPLIIAAGMIIARREQLLHRRPALDPQTGPNAD
jgi:drug/metabolite transporter (DMT)-like permease